MSLSIFIQDSSIKLNDSYIVNIKWNKDDTDYTVLHSCISFQPPVAKYKKETQQIGNNSYAFLIPDWEVGDVTLGFQEDSQLNISKMLGMLLQYMFNFGDDQWHYQENNIYEIMVDVYNNNLNRIVYRYVYHYLKLVNYDNYELDYSSDNILQYNFTFAFMSANEFPCDINPAETARVKKEEEKLETSSSMPEMEIPQEFPSEPNDANTGVSDGHSETGGSSAAEAAAKALAAAKAKMEQDSKTEQVQTPAAENQEIVLDNVDIKASEGKTKETAATNPVDLNKLSGDDRIDELAYRMMRGQLDNGRPRYNKTYKAGYTETERAAAQGIVNQKDWEGLKERHDARVANKDTHYSTAEETAVAKTDYTPNKEVDIQSRSAETSTPASQSTGGAAAAEAAGAALAAKLNASKSEDTAINTKPVESKHETQQPKQQDTQVAQAEPKKEPKSNGKSQISEDQYGNIKVENDTGTLYKTKDGQKYYKLKDNDTIFMAGNDNKLKESKAHDGLVVETINGDTQIYQSIQQGGNEIFRERNVTQEVMTSDGIKESLDRKQATREGGRSGNQYNRGRGGEAAAAAAAAKSAQQQHASAQSSSQKVKTA